MLAKIEGLCALARSAEEGACLARVQVAFLSICERQAFDLLAEHPLLMMLMQIILRMRRTMTERELDEVIGSVLVRQTLTREKWRRKQWQQRNFLSEHDVSDGQVSNGHEAQCLLAAAHFDDLAHVHGGARMDLISHSHVAPTTSK
jgi:hypothetical protein